MITKSPLYNRMLPRAAQSAAGRSIIPLNTTLKAFCAALLFLTCCWSLTTGAGDGPFSPKPPFWERPAFVTWTAASKDPAAAGMKPFHRCAGYPAAQERSSTVPVLSSRLPLGAGVMEHLLD